MPKAIYKKIEDIMPVPTSHSVGEKRVLASLAEINSSITQIAQTTLKAGEEVEAHVHPTIDEHFIVLDGICEISVDEESFICGQGSYLYAPEKSNYSITVFKDTTLITVGVAKE